MTAPAPPTATSGPMHGVRRAAACAVLFAASVTPSLAGTPTPGMEQLFGPTTVNAVTGNGGLSAGVSRRGELVVLKWPSPSYFDHLNYRTQFPGAAQIEDYDEHFGAGERAGSFPCLWVDVVEGRRWTCLRDSDWARRQSYLNEDVPIIVTEYANEGLGLTVRGVDFVKPGEDVLIRRYEFRWGAGAGSPAGSVRFVYLANMAPCTDKTDFVPTDCWMRDVQQGFATVFDPDLGAFIAFKPSTADASRLPADDEDSARRFVRDLHSIYPPAELEGPYELLHTRDVYWVIGAKGPIAGRALMRDLNAPSPLLYLKPDERFVETGPTLLALFYDVTPDSPDVTVVFSVARTGSEARRAWDRAAHGSYANHLEDTRKDWEGWISRAVLPATDDAKVISVVKRALISLRIVTDRESGAIVASITNQPPYGEDWIRDGAFFNYALDLAGYPRMVEKHNRFYASVIRTTEGQDRFGTNRAPAGSFAMNYYPDGRPSGVIDFEIDETGFGLWTLWAHVPFLPPSEQTAYLDIVYPAIRLAADLLTVCRDASNGLQCPAEEDDNPGNQQTLHGASAVLAGLKGAVLAGRLMKEDPARLGAWEARVSELEAAVVREFYEKPGLGHFGGGTGAGAWLIWPAEFLPAGDPRMQAHADYVLGEMQPFFRGETDSGAYFGKATAALARLWRNDIERRARLEPILLSLVRDVSTPDTEHYGEVFVLRDADGDGRREYDMRVAQPHVWEAILSYISARFFFGPVEATPADDPSPSCACHSFPAAAGVDAAAALALAAACLAWLQNRRARERRPRPKP